MSALDSQHPESFTPGFHIDGYADINQKTVCDLLKTLEEQEAKLDEEISVAESVLNKISTNTRLVTINEPEISTPPKHSNKIKKKSVRAPQKTYKQSLRMEKQVDNKKSSHKRKQIEKSVNDNENASKVYIPPLSEATLCYGIDFNFPDKVVQKTEKVTEGLEKRYYKDKGTVNPFLPGKLLHL